MAVIRNKVIIVISKLDEAGQNMKKVLLKKRAYSEVKVTPEKSWPVGDYYEYSSNNISILEIPESQIFTDYFINGVECELMVFASKHSSGAGQKALLVHTTGIWQQKAGHGGNDYELAFVPSNLLGYAYGLIKEYQIQRKLDYWTGIECTHHGPSSLPFPIAFFEAGGTISKRNFPIIQHLSELEATTIVPDSSNFLMKENMGWGMSFPNMQLINYHLNC